MIYKPTEKKIDVFNFIKIAGCLKTKCSTKKKSIEKIGEDISEENLEKGTKLKYLFFKVQVRISIFI